MSNADIKMVVAMLKLVQEDAKDRKEEKTAKQLDLIIDTLNSKAQDNDKA